MAELYFKDPADYIHLEFQMRKNRRSGYSMRAFARDLGFSASSLNDFIKGRVGMSPVRIQHLSQTLAWTYDRRNHFQDLVVAKFSKDPVSRHAAQMRVKLRIKDKSSYFGIEEFKLISDWYNLVIVEICHIQNHVKASDLSKWLGISIYEARNAIHNLTKLEILKDTEDGLKPLRETHQFGDEAPSDAIRSFHSQILQQAQNALFKRSTEERESHSLIFTMNDSDRQAMNKEIRKSLYEIANRYALKKNANSVQIVSLQSFLSVSFEDEKKVQKK